MKKKLINNRLNEVYQTSPDNLSTYFYTFDLGCSATLISIGFELISLDKGNPRKVKFIFMRNSSIEEAVNNYWSDKLKVNARTFFDNLKMLKNRIYSE